MVQIFDELLGDAELIEIKPNNKILMEYVLEHVKETNGNDKELS